MRRHLLIVLVMLCGGTVSSSAIDWGGMKSALDTMVNARIVRWSQTIAADTMAMQFYSYPNSYGSTFKPSYGTGGSGSKGGTFDITKILGGGEPSANDTLSITRIDDKRVQYVAEGTTYFKGPVDVNHQLLKDSIFVTRLTHYLYVQASNLGTVVMKISAKDAGTLKVYAVSDAKYGGTFSLYNDSHTIEYSDLLHVTPTDQATVDWNNFGEQVSNYNLSNPAANKTMSYGKGGSTERKDTTLACYEILYFDVPQGEYYLEFTQETKVYGIELIRNNSRQSIINFPESGLDNLELVDVDIDLVNLEAGKKAYTVLAFENNDAYVKLIPTDGSFKKGDVISIAGAYLSNVDQRAMIDILDDTPTAVYTTEQLVNGKKDSSPPQTEHYTLPHDMDYVIIAPDYKTRTTVYLTKLQVTRASEADKSYRDGPKIVSKVVRWSKTASAGSLSDSYLSVDNPYTPPATSIASIIGYTKAPASSDTLQLTRTDADKVQSLVCDTVYFRSSVDPCSNHYRDSIYVTRFTHYLNTAASSGERNVLKLKLLTEGTLKIFARPVDGAAADRTILVTQSGREVINASLPADGDKEVVNVNTAAFSSVNNYNLANPPKVSSFNIGGRGKNTETDTPTDVDVYPVLYARVDAGELTIEYPVGAVEIYGVELVIIDQSGMKVLIDFPDDSTDGLDLSHAPAMETVTTKSGKTKSCFKFNDTYKRSFIRLYLGEEFKRGDVIKISGFINEDSNNKTGRLMLYGLSGSDPDIVLLTDPLVNVKTDDNDEFVETVTLPDDYPALWIARSIDSTIPCYLSCVKVLGNRDNKEMARIRADQRENRPLYNGNHTTAISAPSAKAERTDAPLYNLSGQRLRVGERNSGMRVNSHYKGIVIRNGRKYIRASGEGTAYAGTEP